MDTVFRLPLITRIGGESQALPLKDIVKRLRSIYCENIGLEYMHISDRAVCKCPTYRCVTMTTLLSGNWIREFFETPNAMYTTEEEKRILLARLVRATK